MCVFAYMYICVCIAIVHIRTELIFAICYIQSFMATLMVAPSPLLGSVSMKACTLHLSLLRPPLPADYRIRFNFCGVKLSRFSRISSHPRKFQRLRPCIRENKNAKIAKIRDPRKFNAAKFKRIRYVLITNRKDQPDLPRNAGVGCPSVHAPVRGAYILNGTAPAVKPLTPDLCTSSLKTLLNLGPILDP